VLAIDFGTTRTKVAYHDDQRAAPRLIELGREQRAIIPSVFYLPKDGEGEVLVGDDAQDMVESDPEGVVVGLKMEIDRYGKIRRGLGRLSIERDRLAAFMFGYIRHRCMEEVFHGQQVMSCCLTVPSGFGEPQRELLRRAAELGGFRAVTLVDEPVAAAQAWLTDSGQKMSDRVLVCDVGGGTTDFALVGITNGRVRVESEVSPGGISLGGNDVDRNVWEQAVELHGDLAQGLSVLGDGFRIKLRRIRERMGIERKKSYSATVGPETVKLSVDVFDKDITAFVENVAQETQRYAGKLKNHTASMPILLVGGGSQMPGLKQALEALKLGPVLVWNNSEFATVLGAVPAPAPKSAPAEEKAGKWEEYRKAVEVCWADKTIQPGEVEHLAKLKKQLGISGNEAEQIERVVTGKTVAELIASASKLEAGPVLDRKAFRKKVSDGNAAAAFEEACRVLEENPSDDAFELWYEAASVVENARVVLDRSRGIQRTRDNDIWGTCCLVLALCELGRKEEALGELAHVIATQKSVPFPLLLAQWVTKLDKPTIRSRLEKQIMEMGRLQTVLLALKAADELHNGNRTAANDLIEQSAEFNPGDFSLLAVRCWAFLRFQLGDEKALKKDLAAVERMAASHWRAHSIKAMWLMRNADWASALSRWHRVLEDPRVLGNKEREADLRFLRAFCHQQCKDGRAALGDIEECLHLNPAHIEALKWRGKSFLERGLVAEALGDYSLAATLAPEDVDALSYQAICKLRMDDYATAETEAQQALELAPENPDIRFLATLACVMKRTSGGAGLPARGRDCYLRGEMDEGKLSNAMRHYIAPHNTSTELEVVLLIDVTVMGRGEDGLCLTEDAVYWGQEHLISPGCLKYNQVKDVEFRDNGLIVNGQRILNYALGRFLVPLLLELSRLHGKRGAKSGLNRTNHEALTPVQSTSSANCIRCGVSITRITYNRTGGFCMPCS